MMRKAILHIYVCLRAIALPVCFAAALAIAAGTASAAEDQSKFYSPEDGWLDFSGFLDEAYGFVPIASPITEPAVGYGLAGGLLFVDRNTAPGEAKAGFGRPNLTAVGGLGTENGTWGVFAADSRYWLDDRLQTLVGVVYASVNLDFFGVGQDGRLRERPLSYNLEPFGGLVHAKYRLGDSKYHVGLGYALASTNVSFETLPTDTRVPAHQNKSSVGGATLSLTYDGRNNLFTPTGGLYLDVSGALFRKSLGSDDDFERGGLTAIYHHAVHPDVTLGVMGSASLSFGDVPFYMRPYVTLRGIQAMRYQGEHAAQVEAELRWQFWRRFSLVCFGGGGVAWNDLSHVNSKVDVSAGGAGFRYELARSYGLHMGLDLAYGPDGPVIYVQLGSAWVRP